MRLVFFTSEESCSNEVFLYMFANVAASFHDIRILAVRRSTSGLLERYLKKLKKRWRLRRLTGVMSTLEQVSSYPLRRCIVDRDEREALAGLRDLPRPPVRPRLDTVIHVDTVNGPDVVGSLRKLEPDVIIQFDAGILQRQVFEVARIGTLNLHPGIAPLIRGADPIYWALWERKPGWLGATVHFIDEGIDTGPVLAYAPVEPSAQGERYPALFVRIYELGVARLVDVLQWLERGERWTVDPPGGERVYRSIIPGWKLALLELRGALQRIHSCWTNIP
jgi:hypothetical protein